MEVRNNQKKFRFSESECRIIKELSRRKSISENQVIVDALNMYASNDVLPKDGELSILKKLKETKDCVLKYLTVFFSLTIGMQLLILIFLLMNRL